MIKTGFEKFQEQCRFCRYAFRTDFKIADCSYTINPVTPFCTHEDNQFEQDGKKYVLKCRLFRCPFYSEKERNEDYSHVLSYMMSFLKWKAEHEDESDSLRYRINESAIDNYKDFKALYKQKPDKQFEDFYNKEWTLLKCKPIPNFDKMIKESEDTKYNGI